MKLLALLALVAIAAASHQRRDYEWLNRVVPKYDVLDEEYKSGRQYEYLYDGQLMTGIPQSSSQHSATRLQAYVVCQLVEEQQVVMKLRHIRVGSYNDRVSNPRQMQPFELFEPVDVEDTLLEILKQPVQFEYINGMIKNIHFSTVEQAWSANIKRAVMNMLQVNLKKEHLLESERTRPTGGRSDSTSEESSEERHNDYSMRSDEGVRKFDFFTSMEPSIEGECETAYTVVSLPSRYSRDTTTNTILNVTRSINFENCVRRPDIRYNHRMDTICPTCEKRYKNNERVLRSSTIIKQNLTVSEDRSRSLIESAIVESHYIIVPFTEEGNIVQTYVNQTLRLVRTRSIETPARLSDTIKSDSQLIFTPEFDVLKEKFFMRGAEKFLDETPYSDIKNKVQFVKTILQKLVRHLRTTVDEEAPRQFTRLVKVLRMLKHQELKKVHQMFYAKSDSFTLEEHKQIQSLLIDAVALCGTKDCVAHVVEVIEQGRLPAIKAALVLRKIPNIRVVSNEIIEKIWTLTSEEKCRSSKMVCQSAYLAVGSLLNAICSPNNDKLAIQHTKSDHETRLSKPQCERSLKNQWTDKLLERFEKCDTQLCRITVLKTIANAAIDESIYKLEPIMRSRRYSPQTRVEAILATRLMSMQMPKKVQKVLMPIYMNKREQPYVRMAAFAKILATMPQKPVLDILSRSLFEESNRQVASFVFTSLHTYANSTNPCEKRMADDLKLSLRHARFMPVYSWMRQSKFLRAQYDSLLMNSGFALDFNSIMSNYSALPKDLATSLNAQFGNTYYRNIFTIGITQQNIEGYLRRFMRRSAHHLQTPVRDLLSGSNEDSDSQEYSPKFNYRKNIDGLFEKLSTASREALFEQTSDEGKMYASLYMRLWDQDYAFAPLTSEMLPEYIREYLEKSGEDMSLERMIEQGEKYLNDVSIPFNVRSATFGYELSRKIPTTFGMPLQWTKKSPMIAQASGILKVKFNGFQKINIELKEFKPSFVVADVDKIEVWSPILNTGLKLVKNVKINAPFNGALSIDMKKPQPEIKFTWKPIEKEYELISLRTRPITTVLVWPRQLQQWKEPNEKTIYGNEWTRMQTVDTQYGKKSLGVEFHTHVNWHYTMLKKVPTTPYCMLSGPNKLSIRVRPGHEMPKVVEVVLSGKLFETLPKQKMSPTFGKKFFSESDEILDTSSESSSESESKESIERDRQFKGYLNSYEGTEPTRNILKLKVSTKGSPIKRDMLIVADWKCGKQDKSCVASIKLRRSPIPEIESEPFVFTTKIETLYPETPYTVTELTTGADKKFVCRIKSEWGVGNGKQWYCDIKLIGEQSDMMQEVIKKSSFYKTFERSSSMQEYPSFYSPVAQYEQTLKYGILDQYKVDIDYKMSPALKNTTAKALRFAKYINYWQSQVDTQLSKELEREGQVTARFNIDPINRRYLNVSIQTPTERVRMYDLPLWTSVVAPLNIRRMSTPSRSFYTFVQQLVQTEETDPSTCQIRQDRVKTFDQFSYRAPITTCYSVVTKDCYEQESSKFVVLVKKQSTSEHKKTIKIITPTVKLVVKAKSQGELECVLNGERKECSEINEVTGEREHTQLRIRSFDGKYIKVELPEAGIRVYFDGYAVNVKSSQYLNGQLCGLCGHKDDEEECELRGANNECHSPHRVSDLKKFYKSFLVRDSEDCQIDESMIDDDVHYEERRPIYENDEELNEFYNEEREPLYEENEYVRSWSSRPRPQPRTIVIEHGDQTCFSKQPIKRCAFGTHPIEHKQGTMKIAFACKDNYEHEVDYLVRRAYRGQVIERVSEWPATFTHELEMPTKCRYNN